MRRFKMHERVWVLPSDNPASAYNKPLYSAISAVMEEGYMLSIWGVGMECPIPHYRLIKDSPLAWVLYG